MRQYTQNCAISFGKTLRSASALLYEWVVSIHYKLSKDLFTNVPIVLALKNGGLIAPGSATQAMEEHHYSRCMPLHKVCFDALV